MRTFLTATLFMILAVSPASSADFLRLAVLDVGEGQSVLLQRGDKGFLIDTGHFGKIHSIREALRKYSIEKIEGVALTHLHADHASGIFGVMDIFPGARIYESGHRIPFTNCADSYRWIVEKLDSKEWKVEVLRQPDTVVWRDVHIQALWPKDPVGASLNAESLVLKISYAGYTSLIMGDSNKEVEAILIAEKLVPENVQVLVVGHHGAADGTSDELLQVTSPKHGVISINNGNIRGYPDRGVVDKIRKSGATVHLVPRNGDFVWSSQDD